VNGHLWHIIPGGGHFDRPFGRSKNDLVYEAIQMHADHGHSDTTGDLELLWAEVECGAFETKSEPLLKGLTEGFKGWREAPIPLTWKASSGRRTSGGD